MTDERTQHFYDNHATELARDYAGASDQMNNLLSRAFPESAGRILDVGCGTGRDVMILLQRGFDAHGCDASPAMIETAMGTANKMGLDPEGSRFRVSKLPELDVYADGDFDGILCNAVLMHLPSEQLFDAVYGLRRLLKPGGALLVSVPETHPEVDPNTRRTEDGRFFADLAPEQLLLLLERVGFRLDWESTQSDSLQRQGRKWRNFRMTLADESQSRPLHQVESILNRDKKDATYKLALFRALAEIAQTSPHAVHYTGDGRVKLPTNLVADQWLLYYWPIVESSVYLSQKNGEQPGCAKPTAVRSALEPLVADFRDKGGLTAFHTALHDQALPENVRKRYAAAHNKLRQTIWNMPVRYAGGGDDFSVLQYDKKDQTILMHASLWRELCLTGAWIRDATILRWAELTARLSKGAVLPSQVIDQLLKLPDPERQVGDVRGFYLLMPELQCVWTEQPIQTRRLEVDHAIPFSLWRNNDLWNLLPTLEIINNHKRDKLPSQELLKARRDGIIHTWQHVMERFPERFTREAQTLYGRDSFDPANWESLLFARFAEAVESTACQRGVDRWQPEGWAPVNKQTPGTTTGIRYPEAPTVPFADIDDPVPNHPVLIPFPELGDRAYRDALPLVGGLAAGNPFHGFNIENLATEVMECDWIEIPQRFCGKNRFVVRVNGDSMQPTLEPGDFAVFEYHRTPRRDGDIVIANLNELGTHHGTETIKRIKQTPTHWLFVPDNPSHQTVEASKEELPYPILGVWVGTI